MRQMHDYYWLLSNHPSIINQVTDVILNNIQLVAINKHFALIGEIQEKKGQEIHHACHGHEADCPDLG